MNRYDEDRKTMDPGFPRIIGESWNGIPDDIDSAFSLNDIGKAFPFLPFSLWKFILGSTQKQTTGYNHYKSKCVALLKWWQYHSEKSHIQQTSVWVLIILQHHHLDKQKRNSGRNVQEWPNLKFNFWAALQPNTNRNCDGGLIHQKVYNTRSKKPFTQSTHWNN